jgi:hypothetical protein
MEIGRIAVCLALLFEGSVVLDQLSAATILQADPNYPAGWDLNFEITEIGWTQTVNSYNSVISVPCLTAHPIHSLQLLT